VARMLELADDATRVIPGHGEATDRAGLTAYREMLSKSSERVRKLKGEGKTVEDVLAARPNADYDAKLSWDFITAERYARILYRDAERKLTKDRT
jgi:cyclase